MHRSNEVREYARVTLGDAQHGTAPAVEGHQRRIVVFKASRLGEDAAQRGPELGLGLDEPNQTARRFADAAHTLGGRARPEDAGERVAVADDPAGERW